MEKIKRIFVGAVMCMMIMLCSSDAVAQDFVDGATAVTRLSQEVPVLRTAYTALDRNSITFRADAINLSERLDAVKLISESIDSNSSAASVELLLRETVLTASTRFTPIDDEMYDEGDFGSLEITDLRSYLLGVLTN